jgi:hypothetical protein
VVVVDGLLPKVADLVGDGARGHADLPQQFVGYTNMGHYVNRVVPTFTA